jgi:hypothetical protein
VSTIVGQRMYPDVLVQRASMPAICYYIIRTEREHTLAGVSKFAHATTTVDCYSTTRDGAQALAKAIRETGIDAFRGTVDGFTFCGVEFISGDEFFQEPPTDGNQASRYVCSFDVEIHYKEP